MHLSRSQFNGAVVLLLLIALLILARFIFLSRQ